jgi:hypothetical protein
MDPMEAFRRDLQTVERDVMDMFARDPEAARAWLSKARGATYTVTISVIAQEEV